MNISELTKTLSKQSDEFKKGTITYGDQEVDFQYKTEMKVSDYEYIFLRDSQSDNHSTLARRIVKLCRDADGERFELDDVLGWPVDLVLMVSTKTIPDQDAEQEEGEKKKRITTNKK